MANNERWYVTVAAEIFNMLAIRGAPAEIVDGMIAATLDDPRLAERTVAQAKDHVRNERAAKRLAKVEQLAAKKLAAARQRAAKKHASNEFLKRVRISLSPREKRLRGTYGITENDERAMFAAQEGCCWICGRALVGSDYNIDHCHVTGRVRGLLCLRCNVGLGQFGDNLTTLLRAAVYLAPDRHLDVETILNLLRSASRTPLPHAYRPLAPRPASRAAASGAA